MADVSQEALDQLLEMGFERSKAQEALSKCVDVARAVEYCFNPNSGDEMMATLTTLTDNQTPQTPNEWNESTTPRNDSDEKNLQRALSESLRDKSTGGGYDSQALVLYNNGNKNDNDQRTDEVFNNWSDPVQPMKRMKLDTTPLGLRAISQYGYAGSLFQALFHIPIFRLAILAYRPSRENWGAVEGYWKGTAMGLQVEDNQMSFQSSDFISQLCTLKFMHEFQKLFGFLSLSKRTYGDASYLMSALDYQDNKIWNDWEASVQEFLNKLLSVIMRSLALRDLIKLESEIPDSIADVGFDILLKSRTRNETIRKYEDYNYQPERKDDEVLSIPLEITPSCNTVYAAFDRKVRSKAETMHKLFFIDIAKILILNLKQDGYTDNSFTSSFGSTGFQIPRELYMDRYMLSKADDVERRWQHLEDLKVELEDINQDIKKITEFQGRHDGSDLLKGSIDYFRRKCGKASDNGVEDENAQKVCSFLEGVLENVEQKLRVLLEKKDEIDGKIKDIFDTPDMKTVVYRLKAVLVRGSQFGQGQHYAYIRGNKTETNYSSNDENGSWWKFCDTTVSETFEEQVLNDMSGPYVNSGVYTLIYVDADYDYNISEINDVIIPSLKDYVEKDNHALEDELFSNNDPVNNQDEYMITTEETEYQNTQGEWNSDSTYSGGNEELNEQKIMQKIDSQIEITIRQAENMVSIHPKINKRFEIFCIKLEQIDLFKNLMHKYYDTNHIDLEWDEPSPLDTRYRDESPYKEYVELFNKYKQITVYFVEGLERIKSDEYNHALVYFKHAINLENDWLNQLVVEDEKGNLVTLHGEKLRRSNEIDAYARACLKIIYEGVLNNFDSKYLDAKYVKRGLEDALRALSLLVGYIGASNCAEDELFKKLKNDVFQCLSEQYEDEEEQELLREINEKYTQPDESLKLKPLENSSLPYDEYTLYDRYNILLKDCSTNLKKYNVPYIQ